MIYSCFTLLNVFNKSADSFAVLVVFLPPAKFSGHVSLRSEAKCPVTRIIFVVSCGTVRPIICGCSQKPVWSLNIRFPRCFPCFENTFCSHLGHLAKGQTYHEQTVLQEQSFQSHPFAGQYRC